MTISCQEARLLIGASETDADLFYATHFLAPDPFVFLWHGDEKILLMSDLEVDRARSQAAVTCVLPQRLYEERARAAGVARPRTVDALLALLEERGLKALTVPGNFPLEQADRLRARGIALQVKEAPFFEERLIKTDDEVEAITSALRRTEGALGAAIGAIAEAEVREGILWSGGEILSAERVKRLIAVRLLEQDLVGEHTIVACGEQGCDPHNTGHGPLRAGLPIILDVFPRDDRSRYFADITRTVVKGVAADRVRRMFAAVAAGQQCALDSIRDGAEGDAVHRAVLETMTGHGFPTGEIDGRMRGFFHGTGHGLGLDIHELPRVSKLPSILRRGNVVTVEPGLYYPDSGGVRLEDVVVVTDSGCRNLTSFPKYLEV